MERVNYSPTLAVECLAEWAERARVTRLHDSATIRARLPRKLQSEALSGLLARTDKRFQKAIREYTWETKANVLFLGITGRGKSTAMGILFRKLLRAGVIDGDFTWRQAQSMRWFRAAELSDAQRHHPLGKGEPLELIRAKSCSILFLDDVGREPDRSVTEAVLAARYDDNLITIMSSELTREEIKTSYDKSVARRMGTAKSVAPIVVEAF